MLGLGDQPLLMAIHFTLVMCLYDGCLSLVCLAQSALLADITVSSVERATCNMYNSALSILGSAGVLFAQVDYHIPRLYLWDPLSCRYSGTLPTCRPSACTLFFWLFYPSLGFNTQHCIYNRRVLNSNQLVRNILMVHVVLVLNNSHHFSDAHTVTQKVSIPNISAFFDQLRKQTNFWVFVAIILLQVSTILPW